MKLTMTQHASRERSARLERIIEIAGIGEPAKSVWQEERQHWEVITTTGILLVMDEQKTVLITAFACNMNKAKALYKGEWNIHKSIKKAIVNNERNGLARLQELLTQLLLRRERTKREKKGEHRAMIEKVVKHYGLESPVSIWVCRIAEALGWEG